MSALGPGTHVGPFEILGALGSGGMGEVYRARDTRLGRDVAVKVLPADFSLDPDRRRRFEQETRAASALNHPNLVSVLDAALHGDVPYIVFEFLQGQTLRERLEPGPLPARKAIEYAVQIAHGLAAAHEAGIVHRDLKPENLFLTADGRLKILDFGLAKLCPTHGLSPASTQATTASEITGLGTVLGTTGYMSPEQVEGKPADHRSDIFSFGSVFSEMLSGRRAFRRDSAIETMRAILKEDPAGFEETNGNVPPPLERIVRRCLEKRPDERFQSARDIAFALDAFTGWSGADGTTLPQPGRSRRALVLGLVAAALASGGAVAGFLFGERSTQRPPPEFHRLTFRRGHAWSARFAPDGQMIVYGAAWDGGPIRLFTTRVDGPESRPMDLPDSDVLAVSSLGELALSLHRNPRTFPQWSLGTLARAPLAGGAPRELLEDVQGASWSPEGKELAVVHMTNGRPRLEFPIGRVLYEADHVVMTPQVSPKGDLVAFIESDATRGDEYRGISIVDRAGKRRTLTAGWRWLNTLAWSPRGDEVWFAASEAGPHCSLWAAGLSGAVRLLARFPSFALLQDVASDGRVLVSLSDFRIGVMGARPGESRERDLSWLDLSSAADLSADGRALVGTESGEGTKRMRAIYFRPTDGSSPAVRLGEGFALALSPDAKWVLARPQDKTMELVLLPTGAGESKVLPGQGIEYGGATWAAGGKRILVAGRQAGRPWRSFVMDMDGRAAPATPEGVVASAISPDGRVLAALDPSGRILLYPAEGGAPRSVPGPLEKGDIGPWSVDGRGLFATEVQGLDIHVFRRDLASGRRESWKEIAPTDPAGLFFVSPLLSADGGSYAYNFVRSLSNLYLVEGLR